MNELVFVGLGLNDEKGITVKGLEETKNANQVFMEIYTNRMLDFSLERFEALCGRKIQIINRHMLEEENGKIILSATKKGKVVFLVPGDPFVATTHVALRIYAEKHGIKTRIVHGTSIISAIVSISGLHNYKFGKTVTIPFLENFSETPYNVIVQNKSVGLHTLCLLDMNANENKYLTINQALEMLLEIENKKKMNVVTSETVAVGIARVGNSSSTLKGDYIKDLLNYDFGKPPYSIIFPGELHFMEIEALIAFAGAPNTIKRLNK